MRTIMSLVVLLALPSAALAEQASTSLRVGVTVVAACPPGSGHPCASAVGAQAAILPQSSARAVATQPIAVVRDEDNRTVTVVY